jgi:hypothetical protein
MRFLRDRSAAASSVGAPEFPGVSSPSVDLDGAIEVGSGIARSASTAALSPVDVVDLPKSDISLSIGVVIKSMGVSSTLMRNHTFAASLIP